MPKLTPWFPGDVKPVRNGLYEIRMNPDMPTHMAEWQAGRWISAVGGPNRFVLIWQYWQWRGLTKEAK